MLKERFVPKGAIKVQAKNSPAFVYIFESAGQPCARAFPSEKAVNPVWKYRFRSLAEREKYVREFFAGQAARAARKAEAAAKKAAYVHDYKPGDVLKGVWGYDQTNVDYFEVVAVIGKMLDIRPLQQAQKGDGFGGSSKCVPLPGSYQGEAVYRVRAQERGIKSPVYGWLHREEPKIIGGVKVYEASYWSSDH